MLIDSSGGTRNLRVQEVCGGTTAADLGLAGINVAASEADGQDIVQLFAGSASTNCSDGAGLSLRPELPELDSHLSRWQQLSSRSRSRPDEPTPRTLGDILDRLNAADPARLQAAISADGERIELHDLTAAAARSPSPARSAAAWPKSSA